MSEKSFDVVIIGAGISGSCIARELSKLNAKICLLDKEDDVSCGTSKANSGIIHVHDLVDYVTEESILAGKCAADYVKEQLASANKAPVKKETVILPVTPGNRVRYTVPQHIELAGKTSNDEKIRIMFRSTDVYRSVTVAVYAGSTLLAQQKKRIVRPGEMQTVELKKTELEKACAIPQPVTVSIEMPEDSID